MSDKTKTITAKQSARRGQHFWDAFNGMTVKINHQRFPDGIFELTYRKRQACFSDEPKPTNDAPSTDSVLISGHQVPVVESKKDSMRYEQKRPLPARKQHHKGDE